MKSQRNATVDYARFVGAIGIVWFHSHAPGGWIGYAALQMFMAFLIFYGVRGPVPPPGKLFATRARRLLVPWFSWSLIYATAKIGQAYVEGRPIGSEFSSWMLLTGPAQHLWFLPYAFVMTIAATLAKAAMQTWRLEIPFVVGVTINIATALVCSYWVSLRRLGIPEVQWVLVFPSVIFGLVLIQAIQSRIRLVLLAIAVIAAYLVAMWAGIREGPIQLVIGGLVTLAALAMPSRSNRLSAYLGEMSLGMYFCHPLVNAALSCVQSLDKDSFALALATVGGSCLLTIGIIETRLQRVLL